MTTDTRISELIINKLTKAQYEAALEAGTISETELYAVTDDDTYVDAGTFANTLANYTTTANLANVALSGEYSDLLNKPTLSTVAGTGDYDDLLNKPTIPAAQVQSDWNATTGMGVILNKPTLATVATSGEYADLLNKPTIDQTYNGSSANAQSGTAVAGLIANYMTSSDVTNAISNAISTVYKYKGSVADYSSLPSSGNEVGDVWNVEDTGDNYAWTGSAWDKLAGTVDLSNYVTLNTAQTLTNKTINLADNTIIGLANVATSGEYGDLLNTPTISTVGSTGEYADLLNKPTLATVATSGEYADLLNKPTLATVAGTGEYSDLLNTPTVDQTYNASSTNAQSGVAISGLIANYSTTDSFSNVAFSGDFADLTNVPAAATVDQVYNASSTNAQSGTAVAGAIANMQTVTNMVDTISNTSTNTTYPTASAVYNATANLSGVIFREWNAS